MGKQLRPRRKGPSPLRLDAKEMPTKPDKIVIEKEKLRPRERAPIRPTRKIEDKKTKSERRTKHKKDLRRQTGESEE